MSPNLKYPPLLVIVGETSSGKSQLAMKLAKRLQGEIICADSWTVRREVNIGSAKPTDQQRHAITHHLIDIVGPTKDFTAAVFKKKALAAIEDISGRHKLAIMAGGTGLYIDSVIFNYQFLKAGDRQLRLSLDSLSVAELLAKIKELNLPLRDNIDTRNKRRLIRVIEAEGAVPQKSQLRPHTLVIGVRVDPIKHQELIAKRVDNMIARGLEQEVRALSNKYGWACEALKGVGYRQWQGYFNGQQTLEQTRQQIVSATNNLAKKQRLWFSRNKSIHWYSQPVNLEAIVDLVTTKLDI